VKRQNNGSKIQHGFRRGLGCSQFAQSRTLKVSERSEEFRIGVKRGWFEICGPKRVQRSRKGSLGGQRRFKFSSWQVSDVLNQSRLLQSLSPKGSRACRDQIGLEQASVAGALRESFLEVSV
jgi:hypothetical protein